MTIFVDASALVSILAEEVDAEMLSTRLGAHQRRFTSALACWEATLGVARRKNMTVFEAAPIVSRYLSDANIDIVPIGVPELATALEAHGRYGKGVHRARLNMGDCFAYACTKSLDARLLYKGADFDLTDLAWSDD